MLCPGIYLLLSWYTNNFSMKYLMQELNYATDFDGFGGLPLPINYDPNNSVDNSYMKCVQGYYIGIEDIGYTSGTTLCSEICQSSDYEYKFVNASGIVINNKEIRGAWCLPKPIARCNLNTSNAFIGIKNYECITNFPQLLGGMHGNQIIGCGNENVFADMLNETTYSKFIPSNLIIDDLDERLPNGEYRYQCKYDKTKYFSLSGTIGNRFDIETNICQVFDSPGTLDIPTLTCKCENDINVGSEKNAPCTNCTSGFEIVDEDRKQIGSRFGYSIGKDCSNPNLVSYQESLWALIPCGQSKMLQIVDTKKTACQRTLIQASNTYSPEMLEKIHG